MDYVSPYRITLKQDNKFGMTCFRARDLIVQEYDSHDNLWATRGLLVYCKRNNENFFRKVTRIHVGFSIFWLFNFSIIRRLTYRHECIEMTMNEKGDICAFTSGYMWIASNPFKRFKKTFKLQHYGVGVGRGIMSTGITHLNNEGFIFGEYFDNSERTSVRIYKYNLDEMVWKEIYEFCPGQIRHIHAVQIDPYTGKIWICAGDENEEPFIGWTDNNLGSIAIVGKGSQKWRACQLVFTEEAVYWGTDTGSTDLGGIYRWDKLSHETKRIYDTQGAVFFGTRLALKTIVMSTDREGFPNEKDDKTRLFLIKNNKVSFIEFGSWNFKRPGFRYNFAKLRLQRNQGSNHLVVSVLNQKEIPDGDLFVFSEEELNRKFEKC